MPSKRKRTNPIDFQEDLNHWKEEKFDKGLNESEPRKRDLTTVSGREIKELYTPADIEGFDYSNELGFPGEFPYTRGIHPTMYRGRLWTIRQFSGFGTAEDTNRRYKYLLEQGQTGLSVAFDLPTQMGYDSNHHLSEGEVGKTGVAIDSLEDMEVLFKDIPLDKVSTSMTINSTASILLAMYVAVAEKQGLSPKDIRGTAQNDILKEYIGRGTWVFPVEPSIRLIGDTIEYCTNNVPKYYPVSVCGYHIRESGANPVQEIAYAFEIAKAYIRHVLDRGLDVDSFVPRFSFNFDP